MTLTNQDSMDFFVAQNGFDEKKPTNYTPGSTNIAGWEIHHF